METDTKLESVAFSLIAGSYNGDSPNINVSFDDLRAAKVGDMWANHDVHNCGRNLYEESIEVVYKTDRGVAVLLRTVRTTNDPTPEKLEDDPQLIWFEFAKGVKK